MKPIGTRRASAWLLATACAAGCPAHAGAAVRAIQSFHAVAAPKPPSADPALNDPAWKAGSFPDSSFQDLTTRAPAPLATHVWMLYDSQNVYVAFHAAQRGLPIVATQTNNDVGFGSDDFVGVGLDTSGAGTNVYYFETTPNGVHYEQANENARFAPRWVSAAQRSGDGWNAVLIIPLSVLRIHGGSPQTWRINFIRSVASTGEHYTWAYDGIMQDGPIGNGWPNFTDQRFWPAWTGITLGTNAHFSRPKPRAELYGLASAGRDRNIFQQGSGVFLPEQVRMAGVDLSYPLTNTINFVGTFSPDFSNVEIDQQTIAPQEFRRQLLEYRPFFAQGAPFINANAAQIGPDLVFYSPQVGPFDRGEKVEGTFGDQSFGVMNFRGYNEVANETFDDVAYGYKHALPDRTFLYWADGVLAHHSVGGSDATTEFGAAARNLKTGFVTAIDYAIERGSWLPQGIAHSATGFVDVHKPNYEILLSYQGISPTYNPIDGFTAAADERGFLASFNTNGAMRGVKNFALFLNADRFLDASGAVHQADFDVNLNATFKNGFSIDGGGPQIGELRSYAAGNPAAAGQRCSDPALPRTIFSGYPGYFCGRNDTYNLMVIPIGYRDGTPAPVDATAQFGRFGYGLIGPRDTGPDYLHLYSIATSRPIGKMFTVGVEYDGSYERGIASGLLDSQFLRRITVGANLGHDENLTISLRAINGTGGFAVPGVNLAAAYHRRFRNGDELFVNFGTPAAPYTLDRTIVKYLFRFGGEAGT